MPKYRVSGKHWSRDKDGKEVLYKAGDIVEMSEAEAAKFSNKFTLVVSAEPDPEETKPQPVQQVKPQSQQGQQRSSGQQKPSA